MKNLTVNASKTYPVIISDSDNGLIDLLNQKLSRAKKLLIISDDIVFPLYGKKVINKISKLCFTYIIKNGEESKSLKNYSDILNFLAKNGFSRTDGIIGLGGGVVGDLACFVAATYMRGISYISVPTTILSFVDSSVGGKSAVNLDYGKNLVGAFYQPDGVYINYSFAKTLPLREVKSGWGEIVKYYFISNDISKTEIENGKLTEGLIYKCLDCKAKIIERDEYDSGERKLLNFGHTFGHAIERLSNFELSHGECVVKGIYLSLCVSKKLGIIAEQVFNEYVELLQGLGYNLENQFSKEDISKAVQMDKKADGTSVDFVLMGKNGLFTQKIDLQKLIGAIYER